MSFAMLWPIALIVFSNIFYNVCSKETPAAVNPFASLTVTYLVGAAFSTALYFLLNRGGSLLGEWKQLNWSSFVLGLSLVGLESGSIYMYQAGWNVSNGQLFHSILLSVCLVFVGVLAYHESLSPTKIAGVLVCMAGLYLISR